MFGERNVEERIWNSRWPIIVGIVVIALMGIQMIRVNQQEQPAVDSAPVVKYATKGSLLDGDITIPAHDFHSTRFDLNRRAKLSGTFQTPSIKQLVSVVVLDAANFENWKSEREFRAVVKTGPVPGGKITPVLEPGTYFLLLDNRSSDREQRVTTEFTIE